MNIDSIRSTCDQAHDRAETLLSESVVIVDAVMIAAERIEMMARSFQPINGHSVAKVASTIVCLADRAKRDMNSAATEMGNMIDVVMGYRDNNGELIEPQPQPAGIPTAAQVRAEDFAAALVTYERAKAAMNGFWNATIQPLHEQLEAAEGEAKDALSAQMEQAEKDFEAFVDQHGAAVIALFNAPSPDLAAHAIKLSVWVETDYQDMTDAADMMKVIAADVARLSQQGEA